MCATQGRKEEPYVYREVHPVESHYPPYRLRSLDANGHNRVRRGEECDSWIIFYPSQPGDDDVYVVYWDKDKCQWLWRAAGYGPFGEPYEELNENMALVILEYFGLLNKSKKYSPRKLQRTPPQKLAEESVLF